MDSASSETWTELLKRAQGGAGGTIWGGAVGGDRKSEVEILWCYLAGGLVAVSPA